MSLTFGFLLLAGDLLDGSFFKPVLPSKDSLLLTELLETDEAFSKATSEKGANLVAGDWDPESVFGLVSALAPAWLRPPVLPGLFSSLICSSAPTWAQRLQTS